MVKLVFKKFFSLSIFLYFCGCSLVLASTSGPECPWGKKSSDFADFGKRTMPLAALGVSLIQQDWWGAAGSQIFIHGLYTFNKPLDGKISKKRPCGCDGAFPSGHMIMYSASASYIHYRYGWQYGFPAYIAAFAFAYDRVEQRAHGWDDMIGTFAIVNLIALLIVPKHTPEVELLPSSWLKGEEYKDPMTVEYYVKNYSMKEKNETPYMPLVYSGKDTVLIGFSMRF